MARFKVTAPEPTTTEIGGVTLVKGVATIDDSIEAHRKALRYFRRRGYVVEELVDETPAREVPATAPDPGPVDEPKTPARSASKADWLAFASQTGTPREDVEHLTRDELAEKYLGPKEA